MVHAPNCQSQHRHFREIPIRLRGLTLAQRANPAPARAPHCASTLARATSRAGRAYWLAQPRF